ncbi:MAG: response regulator transcription factor [Flavobacterium sp.]|nr:MAG: response regulator transcription factor [Flavobacterium sp.]
MKILIADDHPSILLAFKAMLNSGLKNQTVEFSECLSCKETFLAVENKLLEHKAFDLALLDYSMPTYAEQEMSNGGDLCMHIKSKMPNCKVFIITSVIDNVSLFDIIQNTKPDGIALKSDITNENFSFAIEAVLNDKKYRSETVTKKLDEIWETDLFVQPYNRKILYYISQGYRIKEMSAELCISEGAINKRIAKIKVALNVSEYSSILREAKKRGFV